MNFKDMPFCYLVFLLLSEMAKVMLTVAQRSPAESTTLDWTVNSCADASGKAELSQRHM